MAKKIYQVRGTEFKRTTDREYTHAICFVTLEGKVTSTLSFCGSYPLAIKAVATARNQYARFLAEDKETLEIRDVERIK